MNYLIIHNQYSRKGGEESVVAQQISLLRAAGHTVRLYQRDYDEMKKWRFGRLAGLFSALYNRRSVNDIKELIRAHKPDVAIIHNLFPVISPAILPVLKSAGVTVVMTIHNFRLICPTGLFFTKGKLCEKCGLGFREWNCLINKCEGSLAGSFGYALRGWWSRTIGYFDNVDTFFVQSDFHKQKLTQYGVDKNKIKILPNCIDVDSMPAPTGVCADEKYVGFVGRLSAEKGVDLLFSVARLLPDVKFKIAGEHASSFTLGQLPHNVELVGFINSNQLAEFYNCASAIVHTSRCYEGLPLVVLEAMYYGKVVVAQRIAAMPMVLQNGNCGVLADYGNSQAVADALQIVLSNKDLTEELGAKAKENVMKNYSPHSYLNILTAKS